MESQQKIINIQSIWSLIDLWQAAGDYRRTPCRVSFSRRKVRYAPKKRWFSIEKWVILYAKKRWFSRQEWCILYWERMMFLFRYTHHWPAPWVNMINFVIKTEGLCIKIEEFCIQNDEFCRCGCEDPVPCRPGAAIRLPGTYTRNRWFPLKTDDFPLKTDDFSLKNGELDAEKWWPLCRNRCTTTT